MGSTGNMSFGCEFYSISLLFSCVFLGLTATDASLDRQFGLNDSAAIAKIKRVASLPSLAPIKQ